MLRRQLATLLVFSWIVLSGFDLIEDFDAPCELKIHGRASAVLPRAGQIVNLANNIVESAHRPRQFETKFLVLDVADAFLGGTLSAKKFLSLHKLNRIFLI